LIIFILSRCYGVDYFVITIKCTKLLVSLPTCELLLNLLYNRWCMRRWQRWRHNIG